MKLDYDAPVVLTFALACFVVMLLSDFSAGQTAAAFFTAPFEFESSNPLDYLRLLAHLLGHHDWQHLVRNVLVILLIGPVIEERYGSSALLVMTLITAVITAVINTLFFSGSMVGANSVAFLLIMLTSLTDLRRGRIPVTLVLTALLYWMPEVLAAARAGNLAPMTLILSPMAQIIGGLFGNLFGFFLPERRPSEPSDPARMATRAR